MKNNWTVRITLAILMGSLFQLSSLGGNDDEKVSSAVKERDRDGENVASSKAELELSLNMTRKELKLLRKELAGVLKQSEKRDQEYLRLRMSMAASIVNGRKIEYSKQESELLKALSVVCNAGDELVISSSECCEFIEKILDRKTITDTDRARIRLRLDKLKGSAARLHMRIQPRKKDFLFQSCRVLTVNDKLQVVVLNAGATSGVKNGLFLRSKDGSCKLVVVLVKPFISAAVVTKGNMGSLAKGTLMYPGK